MTDWHDSATPLPHDAALPALTSPSTGELRRAVLRALEAVDEIPGRELKSRASHLVHLSAGSDIALEEVIEGFVSTGILTHVQGDSRKLAPTTAGRTLIQTLIENH